MQLGSRAVGRDTNDSREDWLPTSYGRRIFHQKKKTYFCLVTSYNINIIITCETLATISTTFIFYLINFYFLENERVACILVGYFT